MLARRLLCGYSTSMDAEETAIDKLEQAAGYKYATKFRLMFTDISTRGGLNAKFHSHLQELKENIEVGLNMTILQAEAWPLSSGPVSPFALPVQLERSVQLFESYYKTNFPGRKLTWLHYLCNADIKLNYLPESYTMNCSTFTMAIVLQLENVNSISYKELKDITQLEDNHLCVSLAALSEARILLTEKPLAACENQYVFEPSTLFTLNMGFKHNKKVFKLTGAICTDNESLQGDQLQ